MQLSRSLFLFLRDRAKERREPEGVVRVAAAGAGGIANHVNLLYNTDFTQGVVGTVKSYAQNSLQAVA